MTREEIIEKISNDDVLPYIEPWALKEIVEFVIQNSKPTFSSGLDEAAEEYAYSNWESDDYHEGAGEGLPFDAIGYTAKCFKAGAEWQKEQMTKKAEECFVEWYDGLYLNLTTEQMSNAIEKAGAKVGDKVKVIVIKEEE